MLKIKFVLFSFFFVFKVFGCDCTFNEKSYVEIFNSSNVVFKGKVLSIRAIQLNGKQLDEISFTVDKNFKGVQSKVVIIYQESGSDCNVNFLMGEEWLVWANFWDDLLITDICTKTIKTNKISKENLILLDDISSSNGFKIWFDQNGNKLAEGTLTNNIATGFWKYYLNGFLNSIGSYENGFKNGKWTTFFESFFYQPNLQNFDILKNLLNEEKSTIRKISIIENYKNEKKDGDFYSYDFSGKIESVTSYKENKRDGISIFYAYSGKPKYIYNYESDKLNGTFISFFDKGTIELICFYKNNKQDGEWTLYNEESKVICSSKNTNKFPEFHNDKYFCLEN